MKRGFVNLQELRANFDKADFKCGKSSYCFIRGKKIIKVYAIKYGEDNIPRYVEDFSKYKAATIAFPEDYIRENGKVAAEISPYIDCEDITKTFNANALLKNIMNG